VGIFYVFQWALAIDVSVDMIMQAAGFIEREIRIPLLGRRGVLEAFRLNFVPDFALLLQGVVDVSSRKLVLDLLFDFD
jgi:hypothetical protein